MATECFHGVYMLAEEKYFEVVRMIDGWGGINKRVEGDLLVYSPAELTPDLRVRAITEGSITLNNSERTVIISPDAEFEGNLEDKLPRLILKN